MEKIPDMTIYERFQETAARFPNAAAVSDDARSLTYRELADLSAEIAAQFPCPAQYIGILMDHSIEMIAAILAVLRSGAAYVPVEPDFPQRRARYIFDTAGVGFIITDPQYEMPFAGDFRTLVPAGRACASLPAPPAEGTGADPAYVLFTSGSTGKPKGIVVENRNVLHYARAFEHEFHIGPGDTMLQLSVCTFDIFVEEVFGTLLNGAELLIVPAQMRDSTALLMQYMERHHVTIVSGFPYLLLEFNRLGKLPDSVRLLISGGDVLRLNYVDHLLEEGIAVYNTYGPSETTVCATYFRCTPESALENGTFPVGFPVTGARVEIQRADGTRADAGEIGEIVISGDGVSKGYIEGDNSAFTADGAFRSGDLGYTLPDGSIAFVRRKDTQVMIYGRRVETGEVENVLCAVPGIAAAHVLAHEDERGLAYLTAYIVFEDGPIPASRLRSILREDLPPFMIPCFFVAMKTVPLTPNGKPDFDAFPVVLKEGRGK